MPAVRSTRAKCITFSARWPGDFFVNSMAGAADACLGSRGPGRRRAAPSRPAPLGGRRRGAWAPTSLRTWSSRRAASLPCMLGDVVLVLQQHAQRVLDDLGVEHHRRPAPSARGSIRWSRRCRAACTARCCAASARRRRSARASAGRRRARGAAGCQLALGVGEVDPVVQAAALDRVVDLARAVAGEDHDRRLRAFTVPSSGMVIWKSPAPPAGRPRRARRRGRARRSAAPAAPGGRVDGLQQRALGQEAFAEQLVGQRVAAGAAVASASRISIIWRP
jgi:hypothetical protein